MFAPDGPVNPVILGIDPGLSRCGYGAVRADGPRLSALRAGVIRTDPEWPLHRRLEALADDLETLMGELAPEAVAVERVLFQNNTTTAMAVGQASGIALLMASRWAGGVSTYSPNEVKLAVTGDGRADKAQVQTMVARLLGLAEVPRPPDAADALALAITHASTARLRSGGGAGRGEDPRRAKRRLDAAVAAALEKRG